MITQVWRGNPAERVLHNIFCCYKQNNADYQLFKMY